MSAQRGNPGPEHLIAEAVASAMLNSFGATIGIVQDYDDATKTCSVLPAIRRPIETVDGDVVHEAPSIVTNVLVGHWGAASLTMNQTLAAGDAVLLVYLDYSPAAWRDRGQVSDALDTTKNGPSYPVALPFYRPSGGPGADTGESIGKPGGLRIEFTVEHVIVGGGTDFVALKSAVDAIQQNLDTLASFGTPFGPTTPGNLIPAGAQQSSTKLKA